MHPLAARKILFALGVTSAATGAFAVPRAVDGGQEALRPVDERIETLVKASLAADPVVESYDIVVTSLDGAVRLNGTVDTDDERARAGSVAADVDGVTEVDNQLSVEKTMVSPDRSDGEIRRRALDDIGKALPDREVDIRVDDGMATITGVVDSREQRREITEIAFRAGALLVKNQLRIEP